MDWLNGEYILINGDSLSFKGEQEG